MPWSSARLCHRGPLILRHDASDLRSAGYDPVAALLLGEVERAVGAVEDVIDAACRWAVGEAGETGADRDLRRTGAGLHRRVRHCPARRLGEVCGPFGGDARQDEGELLAAVAAE